MQFNRSLDEEYTRLEQAALEERERLRAERDAPELKPEAGEESKTVAVAASLLRDGKPITIAAAVLLLEVYCLPRLKTKPSDGGVRRELEKAERSLWRRKLAELIFQRAREDRFNLIDPILGIPISRPPDPDQWWLIEPGAFEIIKSEVIWHPASPTVIMPPIQGGDFEAISNTLANDHEPAVLPAVIEGAMPLIDSGDGEAAASVAMPADAPSVIPMPWKEALPRWLGKQKHETALKLGALELAKAFFKWALKRNVKLPSRPQRMVKTIEKSLRDMREAAGA
jgi:hypothetical protein